MLLSEIFRGIDYRCAGFTDTEISDIVYDSRKAQQGVIFVCLVGAMSDGHRFAESAYEKGCRVFLCQNEIALPEDATVIYNENTRACLAKISCNFFRNPSKEISVIGITGTKGKTTVAHIIKSVLEQGGIKTGIIGTVGAFYGDTVIPTVNTTPESYELQKILRQMADGGCKAVAMEVSSLGIKHHRTDGICFKWGVFTNLYPDHIGTNEHESFEEYAYWKAQLFPLCENAVINTDDPFGESLIGKCKGKTITYSQTDKSDYTLVSYENVKGEDHLGIKFEVSHSGISHSYTVSLAGVVNALNAVVAVAMGEEMGISQSDIEQGLKKVVVKGRCEVMRLQEKDITVIIDYAHNGISLRSLIDTVRKYEHSRIISLFGSVGGRTECRREELGSVSGAFSDFSVITSDDPNFEEPEKICREIASYCEKAGGKYVIIPDRALAIAYAIDIAEKGDIVILAGKGHETYMKIMGENVPFCERDEVMKAFKKKKEG